MLFIIIKHNFKIYTLLKEGVNPNTTTINDYPPLVWIIHEQEYRNSSFLQQLLLVIQLLIDYGADVNVELEEFIEMGYDSSTPILLIMEPLRFQDIKNPDEIKSSIAVIELLLKNGASPFPQGYENHDPLTEYAIPSGLQELIDLINKYRSIYRIQKRHRGNLTRRKLRTSMARRRSALSRLDDIYGLGENVIQMLNSRISRPSHIDMIDETP